MSSPGYSRRILLVDRKRQLRNAFVTGGSVAAYSLVLGFIIFFPLQHELTRDATPEQQVRAADQILELHRRVWPAVLAVAVLIGFQTVVMTHRRLGPIYRLKKAFEVLRAGDLGHRVVLRKHDDLKELADGFNLLAAELQRADMERKRAHREPACRELVGSAPSAAAHSPASPSPSA